MLPGMPADMPLIPPGKLLNIPVDGASGILEAKFEGRAAPEASIPKLLAPSKPIRR